MCSVPYLQLCQDGSGKHVKYEMRYFYENVSENCDLQNVLLFWPILLLAFYTKVWGTEGNQNQKLVEIGCNIVF